MAMIEKRALNQLTQANGARNFSGGALTLEQRIGAMSRRGATDDSWRR